MTTEERLNRYLHKHILNKLSLDELKSLCKLILKENPYGLLDNFVCQNTDVKFEVFKGDTIAETEYNEATDKFDISINEKELLKFQEIEIGRNIIMLLATLAHEHMHAIQENILSCLDDVTIIDKYLIKLITSHNNLYFIDHGAIHAYCDEIFADKSKRIRQYLCNSITYGIYSNHFHEQEAEQYAQDYIDKLLQTIYSNCNNFIIKDFILDSIGKNYKLLDQKSSNKNFDMFKSELLSRDICKEVKKHNKQITSLLSKHCESKKDEENKLKNITILNDKIRCLLCLCDNDQKLLILKHSLLAKEKHCFEVVVSFLTTEMYLRKNNEHLIIRAALDILRSNPTDCVKAQIFNRLENSCTENTLNLIKTALASSRIIK